MGFLKDRTWNLGASPGMQEMSFLLPLLSFVPFCVLPLLTIKNSEYALGP